MASGLTTMTSGQARFPIAPSKYKFAQHGECGMWVSELLPHTAKMVDDMCFIRSDAHGSDQPRTGHHATCRRATRSPGGRAWGPGLSYGLGSMNENLPTFVVLVARPTNTEQVQAISARLWSSGYAARRTRRRLVPQQSGDPILYINNPPGVPSEVRRKRSTASTAIERAPYEQLGDPETQTRIQQYELAFRMQASVPELTDLASEPERRSNSTAKKPRSRARSPTPP
jgi:hypothetical protein